MESIAEEAITSDVYAGPFHEVQRAAGATFYEDWGVLWTRGFGDPIEEYRAIRRGAALWDVSSLVKFHFTGPDALAALDRLTTRRMVGATPGAVRYCNVLNEQGLILDEGTVLVAGPEEAYLFGNDPRGPFARHMATHTRDLNVNIENVTRAMPNVAIQGPGSFEVVSKLASEDVSALRWFHFLPEPIELAGVPGMLVRAGFTGELGYEFYLFDGGAGAGPLWAAVAAEGALPVGLDAIEMVRIEAGLVICEEDYQPGETDPYELNMEPFIDLDHDFVGREACLAAAGSPTHRLVTLRFRGKEVPVAGTPVYAGGMQVGDVRSAGVTPRYGPIALAVVCAAFAREGARMTADGLEASVHGAPIDDPKKERPRTDPRRPLMAAW